MKKTIILLTFIITSFASYSQEFIGIKVEGTMESVVAKYKAKGFKVSIPPSNSTSAFWDRVGLSISEWQQVCIKYENSVNADLYEEERKIVDKTIY